MGERLVLCQFIHVETTAAEFFSGDGEHAAESVRRSLTGIQSSKAVIDRSIIMEETSGHFLAAVQADCDLHPIVFSFP